MRFIATVTLIAVCGALIAGLHHMSVSEATHGGMTDCPFMVHDNAVCGMSLFDHISEWKTMQVALSPMLLLVLAVAAAISLTGASPPNRAICGVPEVRLTFTRLEERTYTYVLRPLQEYFSSGLLHPKIHRLAEILNLPD